MSGGHFDYLQYRVSELADHLQAIIESPSEYERGVLQDDNVKQAIYDAYEHCRLAFIFAHELDYLISGDTGVDTFKERIIKRLTDLVKDIENVKTS